MPITMTFSQPTPGASPADTSVRDGLADETVTVTLNEAGSLEFLAVPPGVTPPVIAGGPVAYTWDPDPNIKGHKYILHAVSGGDGSESRRTFGIPHPTTGLILPAWNEIGDPVGSEQNKGAAVIAASDDNVGDANYPGGNPTGWARDIQAMGDALNTFAAGALFKFVDTGEVPVPAPPNVFDDPNLLRLAINAVAGPKIIQVEEDIVFEGDVDLDGCYFYGTDDHSVILGDDCDLLNLDRFRSLGFANIEFIVESDNAPWNLGTDTIQFRLRADGYFEFDGDPLFEWSRGDVYIDGPSAHMEFGSTFANAVAGVGNPRVFMKVGWLSAQVDEFISSAEPNGTFDMQVYGADMVPGAPVEGTGWTREAIEAEGWTFVSVHRWGAAATLHPIASSASPDADSGDHGRTVLIEEDSTYTLPTFNSTGDGVDPITVVAGRDVDPDQPVNVVVGGNTSILFGKRVLTSFELNSPGMTVVFRPVDDLTWIVEDVFEPDVIYVRGNAVGEESAGVWTQVGPAIWLQHAYALWDDNSSRVWMGISAGVDTAELRLVRVSDGNVEGTWSTAAAPIDINLASKIVIDESDFYRLELRAAAGTGTAIVQGVDFRWIPFEAS